MPSLDQTAAFLQLTAQRHQYGRFGRCGKSFKVNKILTTTLHDAIGRCDSFGIAQSFRGVIARSNDVTMAVRHPVNPTSGRPRLRIDLDRKRASCRLTLATHPDSAGLPAPLILQRMTTVRLC